jgi:hypothetical protein
MQGTEERRLRRRKVVYDTRRSKYKVYISYLAGIGFKDFDEKRLCPVPCAPDLQVVNNDFHNLPAFHSCLVGDQGEEE